MFSLPIVILCVFGFVTTLVAAVVLSFSRRASTAAEDRLDIMTSSFADAGRGNNKTQESSLLTTSIDDRETFSDRVLSNLGNFGVLLEQADVTLTPPMFLMATAGLAFGGGVMSAILKLPFWAYPLMVVVPALLPMGYVIIKRRKRLSKFGSQLPEALELISRALRAGHSLASGFNLVGDEMGMPIRKEFARCYEEQNLGIPLEEAIEGMTRRVPNLDLRFFATAVTMQRQTGGDLAEILDKIGHLVRERFKIWGQIQALTGEGRLSGIVLLALPPVLFVVMLKLNYDYVMVLFNDEMGQRMLMFAIVMQLIGALVIRKIINIQV